MAEDGVAAKKKRTLLEKYDIPISHLSYEYVKKCNDAKELERIVKILRSGEEGSYPPLLKCTENRLAEIMPESRALCVEEPVLTKGMLSSEHWNQVNNDLSQWSSEMKTQEEELQNTSDSLLTSTSIPKIRSERGVNSSETDDQPTDLPKKMKSTLPRAYADWDKFDADKEILKMDLEEEKKKEDIERKQRANQKEIVKKSQVSRSKIIDSGEFSSTEKRFLANQEKDKGNDYFKVKEYKQAIEHYSTSIEIDPTPVAYNNRAIAYIKLEQYSEALRDCNKVLQVEPDNVKALHRRGVAYKHRGSYQSALNDFLRILKLEPDNRTASNLVKEMQIKVDRKSVRMQISEEDFDDGPKIVELPDEPYVDEPCVQDSSIKYNTSWPQPPDRRVKCNEFGLPKVMCNCSGVPDWVRKPPPKCLICKEIKARKKEEERQKSLTSQESMVTSTPESEDSESDGECVCEHSSASETVVSPSDGEKTQVQTQVVQEETPPRQVERGGGDSVNREEASVSNEATSKGTSPSPPEIRSARKTQLRRVLPPEIKPVKVQVASKYTTKTVVKGEEEAAPGVNKVQGIQGLTIQESSSRITTPFDFITAMHSVPKGSDVAQYAPILRRVDPADLISLIGNKLDDSLLSCILECLEKCFSNNCHFVLKYLENLSALPRFGLAMMFMDAPKRQVVNRLFTLLEDQGFPPSDSLREKYFINS